MELLSPAGSADKLRYAYRWGADAAYIGLPLFSLRAKAENIEDSLGEAPSLIASIKKEADARFPLSGGKPRKLYCTVNIFFHDADLKALSDALPRIAEYPFDGFIVSDMGAYGILRERFPDREYHLSTQANCSNWRAAKFYRDIGFSRVVPSRELSIDGIREMKERVPDLEIEAFIHGAMCMAYSGRCFLSSWMTGRSANKGDCAHSCRWNYRLYAEEEKRPGQMIPIETGTSPSGCHTLIMSSRDLCMIDHIGELGKAGVDSLKIEGRMKSLYYVALVTRAYRWAIDHPGEDNPFADDLLAVSHREYDTGFFFGSQGMDMSTTKSYRQEHLFAGSVEEAPLLSDSEGNSVDPAALSRRFASEEWSAPVYVDVKNTVDISKPLEILGPEEQALRLAPSEYRFYDADAVLAEGKARHGKAWFFQAKAAGLAGREPARFWILRVDNHLSACGEA